MSLKISEVKLKLAKQNFFLTNLEAVFLFSFLKTNYPTFFKFQVVLSIWYGANMFEPSGESDVIICNINSEHEYTSINNKFKDFLERYQSYDENVYLIDAYAKIQALYDDSVISVDDMFFINKFSEIFSTNADYSVWNLSGDSFLKWSRVRNTIMLEYGQKIRCFIFFKKPFSEALLIDSCHFVDVHFDYLYLSYSVFVVLDDYSVLPLSALRHRHRRLKRRAPILEYLKR